MAGVAPLLSPGGRLVARGPPPPRRVRPGRRCGEGSAPHDPAAALSELDNALDIIAGNLQPGIGDAQGLARWRGQQRSIQAVRDQLAEAAAPRQPPHPSQHQRRRHPRPRGCRRGDPPVATRRTSLDAEVQRPDHSEPVHLRTVGQPGAHRVQGRQRGCCARRRRQRRGARPRPPRSLGGAAPADPRTAHGARRTTLLDNGDIDESRPEARRVAIEARATAARGVCDTDAMLALLREAGVEQPEVELDRLRQRLRPADHVAAIMARYDAHQAHTRPASPRPSRDVLATAGTLHNRHGLADHGGGGGGGGPWGCRGVGERRRAREGV